MADLVVAVCDNAHEDLEPGLPRLHWSIPDPVRVGTDAAFDAAYDEIMPGAAWWVDVTSASTNPTAASPSRYSVRDRAPAMQPT